MRPYQNCVIEVNNNIQKLSPTYNRQERLKD